jgi:hypothetical protein
VYQSEERFAPDPYIRLSEVHPVYHKLRGLRMDAFDKAGVLSDISYLASALAPSNAENSAVPLEKSVY